MAVLRFILAVQAEVDVHLPVTLGLVYVIPAIAIIALDNVQVEEFVCFAHILMTGDGGESFTISQWKRGYVGKLGLN